MLSSRKRPAAVLGLALVASVLALAPAGANPAGTGLVISEAYVNGGSTGATFKNKFVELFNPTAAPITITGSVQYRSPTGTGNASGVAVLTDVTIPANEYFLIQGASNNASSNPGADLPTPDLVSTLNPGSGGGTLYLTTTTAATTPTDTTVVDKIGWGTSNSPEGTATSGNSIVLSYHRNAAGADTDVNSTDFATATPTPVACGAECAAPLTAVSPGTKNATAGNPISGFTMSATGGAAPYTWEATGLPTGVTMSVSGAVSGTPTTAGTYPVTATVTDSAAATDDVVFDIVVVEDTTYTIAEIQGTGARSPFAPESGTGAGATVTTQGVVTGMYADPYPTELGTYGGFDGMYIQTPGADTPDASDGIFVYGSNSMPAGVAIGDSVEVTGPVSEFSGSTQITPAAGGVTEIASIGTAVARAVAYPTTESAREAREGELLAPTDTFTVTNSYSTNQYGEVGLATGDSPLVQPTDVAAPGDAAGIAAVKSDNIARGVVLDDGTSINYLSNGSAQQDLPLPWLTPANAVRVGAEVALNQPVILEYRFSWRFQPTLPVTDSGSAVATFEDTRTPNLAPQPVGGDLKIATFNVLNYFNTTGQQYVINGNGSTACTYYDDRDGNPIGNRTCGVVSNGNNLGNGPRGAATQVSFERQQAKIVEAINSLDADVVALEEIENSMKLVTETNRDDAVAALVQALNADAGAGTWKFVHSPAKALTSSAISEQDVIRSAFIYRKATVQPVGQSDILFGTTEFANAREPLAQAFKPKGALDSTAFAVIANHFKSKGDSTPPATGDNANNPDTGAFNGDRVRASTRLVQFANDFAAARGTDAVFLAGDFNAYTMEEPMQVLYDAGFDLIESSTAGEETYSFSGLSGSLDHVLGNTAAMAMVTGADIWEINANESVAYQYSRFNYNVRELFDGTSPFAASDHNPEIIGLDLPDFGTDYTPVQLIATNDFHGRLLADGANAAGAAVLSGAVKELREDNPNTVFAAAGDLIGASTFESFIQQDEPTIHALNEAGLEVSAAGNHEFDAGYEDLVGRVQSLADWEYIAANVVEPEGRDDLAETWTRTFGSGEDAIKVGFVGAVTEDLPALVSPDGIQGVTVTDVVDATNAAAADLTADGADLVVLLVHEGSPSTSCPTMTNPATTWGNIVTGVSDEVDAIVSGHTHLAYNCSFPVPGWVTEGRAVTERPVVSAGQYGTFLNQLVFTFDNATGDLVAKSQEVIGLVGTGYQRDDATKAIVDDAVAQANVLGSQELGQLAGPFKRARLAAAVAGSDENRGGESTLGNLVAEVQRWATRTPEAGSAEIAFMNPGGLRADMVGTIADGYPEMLTYRQAANVQPFANTLVNMDLTGAQLKTALEQQWQRDANGNIPSRPFLKLGSSEGFTYTYDPARAEGDRITQMWLDGEPIDLERAYSVTVNSFLASGGDNFRVFKLGTGARDTGKIDLQAMVDYMAAFAGQSPLPVDWTQRSVGVSFADEAPETYQRGDHVQFDLSSLAFTGVGDVTDSSVEVSLGDQVLGTFDVDNAKATAVFDEYGKASVDVVLPDSTPRGVVDLTVTGLTTGTTTTVPVTVEVPKVGSSTTATAEPGSVAVASGTTDISVEVVSEGDQPTGEVVVSDGETELGRESLEDGEAVVTVGPFDEVGTRTLSVTYLGDDYVEGSAGSVDVEVTKADSQTEVGEAVGVARAGSGLVHLPVVVSAEGLTPTGTVEAYEGETLLDEATLVDGEAVLALGPFDTAGARAIEVRYAGDDEVRPSSTSTEVVVEKAISKVKVQQSPDKVYAKKTRVKLDVEVVAEGLVPTGVVSVTWGRKELADAELSDGTARLRLPKFAKKGMVTVKVIYSGSDDVARSVKKVSFKVRPKK